MASHDLNIGPSASSSSNGVGPVPTSRALTRVTPVFPHPTPGTDETPADRSGLNVRQLAATADEVVARSRTPAVALDMGLEHARGSVVSNNPAEALAILDEVWSGARHTETGWYLRASSLALLGLPAEAARVASDAVLLNPQSAANHFLLSLARLSLGELQLARASIADAARHRGADALLLVQSALLEAQSGDIDAAEQLLKRAATEWPDHPALSYGRKMIRELLQNAAREKQFAAGGLRDEKMQFRTPSFARTPVSANAVPDTENLSSSAARGAVDMMDEALQQLGATLRGGNTRDIQFAARCMLSALATGGALANASSPARAYALRGVLSALLSALNVSGTTTSVGWAAQSEDGYWQRSDTNGMQVGAPETHAASSDLLAETVRAVVTALRENRISDALQQLNRTRGSVDNLSTALLRILIDGDASASSNGWPGRSEREASSAFGEQSVNAQSAGPQSANAQSANAQSANAQSANALNGNALGAYVQNSGTQPTVLAPLRLGLALLPESDLLNHALWPPGSEARAANFGAALHGPLYDFAPGNQTMHRSMPNGGFGALVAATGLFALAVLAFAFQHPLLGVGIAGAGGWLTVRRHSTRA